MSEIKYDEKAAALCSEAANRIQALESWVLNAVSNPKTIEKIFAKCEDVLTMLSKAILDDCIKRNKQDGAPWLPSE